MVMVSDDIIKAMGFEENDPPLSIQCKFFCLKVYRIEGIHFDPTEGEYTDRLNEYSKFGIGSNVNDICIKLINDKYTEDLETWTRENGGHPPYLITLTTNNVDYTGHCKWSQRRDDQIHTYDCFLKAKLDLDESVEKYEVPYIPALVAMLTFSNNLARLVHVDTSKYGMTVDGETLLDRRISGSGRLSTSSKVSLEKSFSEIVDRLKTYLPPGERFARLMYSAIQETDDIKSFLFAWTSIEVCINKYFQSLDVTDFPERDIPDSYVDRINALFSDTSRGRKITTIAQKFAYLSVYHWQFLDIDNFDTFMNAKNKRDKFTHGDKIDPSALPTREILLLESKIIRHTPG